jgi:hypothetical protein
VNKSSSGVSAVANATMHADGLAKAVRLHLEVIEREA